MRHHHQITCAQFVELADAFALDALDEIEQRACAGHVTRMIHHHGCRQALAGARDVVDRLAVLVPGGVPPAALWRGIQARLGVGSSSSNAEWL